jgi:hypothetical protein
MRPGDNSDFIGIKSKAMTPDKININAQNMLEIATIRCKTIIAQADREVMLKLTPEAGIQGFIVLLQPSLPSIC